MQETDLKFMTLALDLARSGLGRTAPNPSVGCLIVNGDEIVGKARTGDGGRPHAEALALAAAGGKARGGTAYVTLEPCNTHGKTPPCIDALITSGIARVVIACRDPYQQTHGAGGIEKLRQAGLRVDTGLCESEALALNEGFFLRITENRPFVTLKLATTLDGRIATAKGESKWITGPKARIRAHELRGTHDAVLAGIGTVLADDPLLTVRLQGHDGNQPVRIVIDPTLKIPLDSQLVRTAADSAVWVLTGPDTDPLKSRMLEKQGVLLISLPHTPFPPLAILNALASRGITRLLVEGGGKTSTPFLQAGLIDALAWFRAPKLLGADGVPAIGNLEVNSMNDMLNFTLVCSEKLGEDTLEIFYKPPLH
jgi:diaminohydroxyphosphoribosylaminopyrimidine deaminase/5-amino-6-(5-phosphoribosylamino)uracil reductase